MKAVNAVPLPSPDHLFISYAWEDQAFAKWLALRLTAEGYKVWIDQFKLLGGESWPQDIDAAKLNYNACKLGDSPPVTVGFSDAVGEILISNPSVKERRPQFRLLCMNTEHVKPRSVLIDNRLWG